jgi:sRNA-binding regulator protein Hfq
MQNHSTTSSSEEQIVGSKVSGTYRENSLFHFIVDHYVSMDHCITQIHTEANPVVYCAPKNFTLSDGVVFPNHQLIPQNNDLPHHLTCHKTIVSDHHISAKIYNPAHSTLIYVTPHYHDKQEEFIVVHENYNSSGHTISTEAKAYPYHPKCHREGEGRKISLDHQQKEVIHKHAIDLNQLLKQILMDKAQKYADLFSESVQIADTLTKFRISEEPLTAVRAKAIELRNIAIKLSLYDGVKIDGRIRAMDQLLEELSVRREITPSTDNQPVTAAESPVVASMVPATVPITKPSGSAKTSKKSPDPAIQLIKNKIQALINKMKDMHTALPISSAYVADWEKLESLFTDLQLSSTQDFSPYIETQRQRLLVSTSLLDYFRDCIKSGDSDAVRCIFPEIEYHYDLTLVFNEFIRDITTQIDSDLARHQWPEIGQYWYENSELFRCQLKMATMILLGPSDACAVGYALEAFLHDNLAAFQLMIKPMNEETSQLKIHDKMYGLLEAIIDAFKHNPNPKFVQEVVIQFGNIKIPTIGMMQKEAPLNAMLNTNYAKKFTKDLKEQFLLQNLNPSNSNNGNGLELATRLWRKTYPELIEVLASHATIEQLLLAFSAIVSKDTFITRMIPCPSAGFVCFPNKEDCESFTLRVQQGSALMQQVPNATQECAFLFFPRPSNSTTMSQATDSASKTSEDLEYTSIQHLLKRIHVFSETNVDVTEKDKEIRKIMYHLSSDKGNPHAWLAGQLCYILLETHDAQDHQTMLRFFVLFAMEHIKRATGSANAIYQRAFVFLTTLSETEHQTIAQTKMYQHVLSKLPKDLQTQLLRLQPELGPTSAITAPG